MEPGGMACGAGNCTMVWSAMMGAGMVGGGGGGGVAGGIAVLAGASREQAMVEANIRAAMNIEIVRIGLAAWLRSPAKKSG
jgi:hypothetical protein